VAERIVDQKIMRRLTFFVMAFSVAASAAALAQSPGQRPPGHPPAYGQGTDRERAACASDVVRFCGRLLKDNQDPDVLAIVDCLQTNRPKISAACRAVLDGHGV
jgi:hypothetical protein